MPLGAFPFVIRNSTQSLGGGREGDIGEAEMFAAGLVGSPLGKEWVHKKVSLVSSHFRLESVSTKPAALLPMNCGYFDFSYAVAFSPSVEQLPCSLQFT